MNVDLACRVVEKLWEMGVTQVCLCAGGRNGPLVAALQECPQLQVWHFFEERSAAFFALGRSWARRREPVAVITTSGTAAGELLPAIMEAHYAGIPLIAVTADRPRAFRGTGAPQSAVQVGLFSHYVKQSFDIASLEDAEAIELRYLSPLHLNVCFSEPLLDGPVRLNLTKGPKRSAEREPARSSDLGNALEGIKRPLLILSHSSPNPLVTALLDKGNCLVYAEAGSQQRRPCNYLLRGGTGSIPALVTDGVIDGVIRLGGVPTLRFWRDLEDRFVTLPVVSLCSPQFSGLARPSAVFGYHDDHLKLLSDYFENCDSSLLEKTIDQDTRDFQRLNRLLELYPRSEPAWIRWLSEHIGDQSRVFLGNSLPIREWDLAASYSDKDFTIHCTRGLNGIDGQVSTFCGWAREANANVGIFGDLTTLYDLSAPWILRQRPDLDLKIVVINNRGGQIFERMFGNSWFLNAHDVAFEHWAKLWGLEYVQNDAMLGSTARRMIVEITPDANSTHAFWREYAE